MESSVETQSWMSGLTLSVTRSPLLLLICLAVMAGLSSSAYAQQYQVIHNFTGHQDGALPEATLTRDQAGNFYGTTSGSVFKLTKHGSSWVLTPLYDFSGGSDGQSALSSAVIGPNGSLYGTTLGGGYTGGEFCSDGGCGVVYNVTPGARAPASAFTPWTETVIHAFVGPPDDGNQPVYGPLIFDQAGNIYGTTNFGGNDYGAVFELTPDNGRWRNTILYGSFNYVNGYPMSGVVMDAAGNLYGTTQNIVYELSPYGSGWALTTLHTFMGGNDGGLCYSGLVFDSQGNLYGATATGGANHSGVVFELTPSNGSWTYNVVFSFPAAGEGPFDTLTFDAAGNLYGTTMSGGIADAGSVFKLTPSNGSWTLTTLHDFSFQTEWFPYGGVAFDTNGNLLGTTEAGGANGLGTLWEITP